MALNNSGPLSFGGATVGQSINLELGVSATALASINSTSFRTLAGVASGQISVSNFYGKSNVQGWVGTYSYGVPTTTYYQTGEGVGFDSSNNIFVYGRFGYPSNNDAPSLIKINSTGVLQGGITIASGVIANDPDISYGQTLTMDSSGNPYVSAIVNDRPGAIKFNNAANAVTWVYNTNLGNSIFGNGRTGSIITDFSGNIWVSGWATQGGSPRSGVMKVTQGGSLTFSPWLTDSAYIRGPAAVDPSGNFVYYYQGTFWVKVGVGSYAGIAQINQTSTNRAVQVCDSSGNLYIASQQSGAFCILTKMNSSFVEQWSRKLSGYTNNGGPRNIIVGGDGNIYICGGFNSAAQPGWIVKYNSSGVLQWQRSFYNANQDTGQPARNVISAIAYSSYGLAFTGRLVNNAGSSDPDKTAAIMGIIPLIGNGTGSYNPSGGSINITYGTLSGTDSANTFGASSGSPSGPGVNTTWDAQTPTTVTATGSAYKSNLA